MAPEAGISGDDFLERVKSVLMQLQGVVAAQAVLDREGEITEIHILADSHRASKQIVRDVESALLTRLDLRVDHRKISVAQIDRGRERDAAEAVLPMHRLRVKETNLALRGCTGEATVVLIRDGAEARGVAAGPTTLRNTLKLTARATLAAIKSHLADDYSVEVEDVVTVTVAQREIVLVLVSMVLGGNEVELVGSSIVRSQAQQAVVSATLDAMNRYLGSLRFAAKKAEGEGTGSG